MAPRAEAIVPEQRDTIPLIEVDLGGYTLYDGVLPDTHQSHPFKIPSERIPPGIVLYIPEDKINLVQSMGKTIDLQTYSTLAEQAVKVTMSGTSIRVTHVDGDECIVKTSSIAVSRLLHTFFETHNRRMLIYRNPAVTDKIILDVDGHLSRDDTPVHLGSAVCFRTEYQPDMRWVPRLFKS